MLTNTSSSTDNSATGSSNKASQLNIGGASGVGVSGAPFLTKSEGGSRGSSSNLKFLSNSGIAAGGVEAPSVVGIASTQVMRTSVLVNDSKSKL